jgi:hypothetical protein
LTLKNLLFKLKERVRKVKTNGLLKSLFATVGPASNADSLSYAIPYQSNYLNCDSSPQWRRKFPDVSVKLGQISSSPWGNHCGS